MCRSDMISAVWLGEASKLLAAKIPGLSTLCYSVLEPGCHIKPHREHLGTSGVRAHLGLQIPTACAIRVGANALKWRQGQWTIFNGTRSHEVLNMATWIIVDIDLFASVSLVFAALSCSFSCFLDVVWSLKRASIYSHEDVDRHLHSDR